MRSVDGEAVHAFNRARLIYSGQIPPMQMYFTTR